MIDTTILVLIVTLSFLFSIIGIVFKKEYYYLSIVGGLILLILGSITIGNPIVYKTGAVISNNGIDDIVTNTYAPIDSNLNFLFSTIFILVGLASLLISILNYKGNEKEKQKEYAESFDD